MDMGFLTLYRFILSGSRTNRTMLDFAVQFESILLVRGIEGLPLRDQEFSASLLLYTVYTEICAP